MPSANSVLKRSRQEDDLEDIGKGPYTTVRFPGRVSAVMSWQFVLIAEQDDTLTAYTYDDDETTGAIEYTILKPWLLRRTPFDGETRNEISYVYSAANSRVASKVGESDENQVISPAFVEGDVFSADIGIEGVDNWLMRSQGRAWSQV